MATQPLTFALSQDKSLLVVSPASVEPFAITAAVTEELIRALIATRAGMEPKQASSNPATGAPAISHPEMRWYAAANAVGGGEMQICLAHPGLGWVAGTLGRDALKQLMQQIQRALASN